MPLYEGKLNTELCSMSQAFFCQMHRPIPQLSTALGVEPRSRPGRSHAVGATKMTGKTGRGSRIS